VAIFTDIGRIDMRDVLSLGRCAVVTAEAVCGYRGMIKIRGQPGIRRVAVIADIAAGDMVCVLTRRGAAIVATRTKSQHL
jgi:hypothetical protein